MSSIEDLQPFDPELQEKSSERTIAKFLSVFNKNDWSDGLTRTRSANRLPVGTQPYEEGFVDIVEWERVYQDEDSGVLSTEHVLSIWEYSGTDPNPENPHLVTRWSIDLDTNKVEIDQMGELLKDARRVYGRGSIHNSLRIPDDYPTLHSLAINEASTQEQWQRLEAIAEAVLNS